MKPLIALVFFISFGTVQAQTTGVNKTSSTEKPAPLQTELPVKPLGTFMKIRSDGEHAAGYDVELWRQGGNFYGLISAHRGLIGDAPAGLLENIRFDSRTKKFSFTAKLSLGQNAENLPPREVFEFEGTLTASRLAGRLLIKDATCGAACIERKKINLPRSPAESRAMSAFKTYAEWKTNADQILEFRGPRW